VIGSYEYGKVIEELYQKGMYKEILAINDSCEAITIWEYLISPNIFAIGYFSMINIQFFSLIFLKIEFFSLKIRVFTEIHEFFFVK